MRIPFAGLERHRSLRSFVVLTAVTSLVVSACSFVLEGEGTQCSTDQDCTNRGLSGAVCQAQVCVQSSGSGGGGGGGTGGIAEGGQGGAGAGGPWDCIGDVTWPPVQMDVEASFGLLVTNSNFEPYEGLELRACKPLDIACTEPISTGISGADGQVFLDVNAGYEGYVRSTVPAANPEFLPFILHIFPPPAGIETEVRNGDVLQIDQPSIELLAGLGGIEVEPDTGVILFTVLDCTGARAPGVAVSVSPVGQGTAVAYLEGSFPNADLTETGDEGQGAVLNVPPGLVEVTGVSLEAGKMFEMSVLVEANTLTGVPVVPSPL